MGALSSILSYNKYLALLNHELKLSGVNSRNGNYNNQIKVKESSPLPFNHHKCTIVAIYTVDYPIYNLNRCNKIGS